MPNRRSIRTKLQIVGKKRDLALFNLAIDSKLRGCDVVAVRVDDVAPSGYAMDRATIRQKKTGRPVRFVLTDPMRQAIDEYLLGLRAAQRVRAELRRIKSNARNPLLHERSVLPRRQSASVAATGEQELTWFPSGQAC